MATFFKFYNINIFIAMNLIISKQKLYLYNFTQQTTNKIFLDRYFLDQAIFDRLSQ